jgi:ABC-type sugar transport system ATPase subunit
VGGASFDVRRGEVLGLAGLIGSGRTEIARAMFGVDPLRGGYTEMCGRTISVRRPSDAIRNRIAFLTENRKSDGLLMNFFSGPNITIVNLKKVMRRHFLHLRKERSVGQDYIKRLRISADALDKSVQFLSGGNQQKVIIARWLHSEAELFILDEPTQGIDINAKVEVYNLMNQLTAQGKSIILISSDFQELLAMSDRLAIVKDGRVLSVVDAQNITKNELMGIILGNQSNAEVNEQ